MSNTQASKTYSLYVIRFENYPRDNKGEMFKCLFPNMILFTKGTQLSNYTYFYSSSTMAPKTISGCAIVAFDDELNHCAVVTRFCENFRGTGTLITFERIYEMPDDLTEFQEPYLLCSKNAVSYYHLYNNGTDIDKANIACFKTQLGSMADHGDKLVALLKPPVFSTTYTSSTGISGTIPLTSIGTFNVQVQTQAAAP